MKQAFTALKPTPERAIVAIKKEQRKGMFEKAFVRDDGTTGVLITGIKKDRTDDGAERQFINTAEVVAVGDRVKGVQVGDTAILDYLVSNDDTIRIHEDDTAEYYSVRANTTYEPQDVLMDITAKRDVPMYLCRKGEIKEVSQIIGFIRGEDIFAMEPFLLLSFEAHEQNEKTQSGIVFKKQRSVLRHEVLAVSPETTEKYGIEKGMKVCVEYAHCFGVDLPDPYGKVVGVNDQDVLIEDALFLVEA